MRNILLLTSTLIAFVGCKADKSDSRHDDSPVPPVSTSPVDDLSGHPKHIQEIAKLIAHIPLGSSIEEFQNSLKKTGSVVTPHTHFKDYEYYWKVPPSNKECASYIITGAFANGLIYTTINLVEEAGGKWKTVWSLHLDTENRTPVYIRTPETLTFEELLKTIEHKVSQGATAVRFSGGKWQWYDLTQLKLESLNDKEPSNLILKYANDDFEKSLSNWITSNKVKAVQISFHKDLPAEAFFKVESILTKLNTPYLLMSGGEHNTDEILFFQSDGRAFIAVPKELLKTKIPVPEFLDDSNYWDF